MDPLTHVMAGALVGHAFSGFTGEPAATLAAVSAAVLPDLDFYARKYQGVRFLKIHHGPSHSISMSVAAAFPIALIIHLISRIPALPGNPAGVLPLFVIALVSYLSHIFLDWIMHNNGLPLLWPLSTRHFAVPLILGVNPMTVSLNCGDRKYLTCLGCQSRGSLRNPIAWIITVFGTLGFMTPNWRRMIALTGIAVTALWIVLVLVMRRRAHHAVRQFAPDLSDARIFPGRARPDRWLFVREFRNGSVTALLADSFSRSILQQWQFPPPLISSFVRHSAGGILDNAREVMRFPYPEVSFRDNITRINIRDLSYLYAEPMEIGSVKVAIDDRGEVISEIYQEIW